LTEPKFHTKLIQSHYYFLTIFLGDRDLDLQENDPDHQRDDPAPDPVVADHEEAEGLELNHQRDDLQVMADIVRMEKIGLGRHSKISNIILNTKNLVRLQKKLNDHFFILNRMSGNTGD
jgi:hypothetical protein